MQEKKRDDRDNDCDAHIARSIDNLNVTPTKKPLDGFNYDSALQGERTQKSQRSGGQKKNQKITDTSLLNFHFERPTQTTSYQSQSSFRNPTPSERKKKARLTMLSKESFLQANFRFIVSPTANILDPGFYNSDCPVPWDIIDCVIVPHTETRPLSLPHSSDSLTIITPGGPCPICLGELKIPRMTKCGHLFCYTCILRYLGVTNELHQKCPLCSDRFSKTGLKAVKFCTVTMPEPVCSAADCHETEGGGGRHRDVKSDHDKDKGGDNENYRDGEKEEEKEGYGEGVSLVGHVGKDSERVKGRQSSKGRDRERKACDLDAGNEQHGSEKRNKSNTSSTRTSKTSHTMELLLLFVEKDSLFPSLPLHSMALHSSDMKGYSNNNSSNGTADCDNRQSAPRHQTQTDSMRGAGNKQKPMNKIQNNIPGSSSLSSPIYPTVQTLSESSLVPLTTEGRGKYSRITTVTVSGCLQFFEEEREQLMCYRRECLDSGTGPEFFSSRSPSEDFSHDNHVTTNSTSRHLDSGSSDSRDRDAAILDSEARPRSNSCWNANTQAPTPSPASLAAAHHRWQQRQQQLAREQVYLQGDTEYLPSINEALLLLSEKQETFKDKCHKLGLSTRTPVSIPPTDKIQDRLEHQKTGRSDGRDNDRDNRRDAHTPLKPNESVVEKKNETAPSSTNHVHANVQLNENVPLHKDRHEDKEDEMTVRSKAIPRASSLSPSSTPFVPSSSSCLAASSPETVSVSPSDCEAAGTFNSPLATSPLPTPSSSSSSSSYHMFQAVGGDLIFLHPLCTKCLLADARNDSANLPHYISGPVLEIEKIRVTALMKQKVPFLRFLPEFCEIAFVELSMTHLVKKETIQIFREDFDKRIKKRKDKEKSIKKEKKLEHDETLAHMLYVEEVNALHHQSSRKQSLALRELLAGPKVGDNDEDGAEDREDGEEMDRGDDKEGNSGQIGDAGKRNDNAKDFEKARTVSEDVQAADSGVTLAASPPAALSFAHITQIGKGESFPSLGSSRPKATTGPATGRTKTSSSELTWGRAVSVPVSADASGTAPSAIAASLGKAEVAQGGQGWGKKGTQLLSNSSSRSYR